MIPKTKILSVAGMAVVALGLLASLAQAEVQAVFMGGDMEAEEHVPTFVRGTQSVEDPIIFTAGENAVGCSNAEMSAEIPEGTAEQFPISFEFSGECTAGGFPATIEGNDCHLVLQTAETAGEDSYTGSADLKCPESAGVELWLFAGGSHGFKICTIVVAPQNGLEGAVVHNSTEAEPVADLEVTLNAEGLATKQSGLCGASESTATLEGSATVQGSNSEDEPVDIWIDHE